MLTLCVNDAAAGDAKVEAQLGHQISILDSGVLSLHRVYGEARGEAEIAVDPDTGNSWELAAAFRALAGKEGEEVSVRALSVTHGRGPLRMRVGFQEIPWGETFGFPVADIVNPRDMRDPLLLDASWVRLPTLSANAQLTLGDVRIQAIATPVPRATLRPKVNDPLSLIPVPLQGLPLIPARGFDVDRVGRDTEAGGRIATLVAGVDVSLFYLWHWNRTPTFDAVIAPEGPRLEVVQERVHSGGLGFSKALDDFVLRGDFVGHQNEPHQSPSFTRAVRGLRLQSVVGADYQSESRWVFGAQYQLDVTSDWTLHWLAAHASKGFFDGKLKPEVFVFRGVGNNDTWVQPMLTVQFWERVSISARGDFVWASAAIGEGVLGPLDGVRRAFVWTRLDL